MHATHLTRQDIALLGDSRSCVCLCPSTEAFLADGIGPAAALAAAGCPLSLGSDSHAVIDLLAEARLVELGERLRSWRTRALRRGRAGPAACGAGHACLGWPEAGEIVPGAVADLVTVRLDTPRLAGAVASGAGASGAVASGAMASDAALAGAGVASALASVIFAGTAADVSNVVAAAATWCATAGTCWSLTSPPPCPPPSTRYSANRRS